MLRRTLIVLTLGSALWAQDAPAPLTKEEIAAVEADQSITLPMPGELFAALGKHGTIDWSTLLRKTPSEAFTKRQQIALNLGTLVADGYLAVEAQDKQAVKNVAKDIRALARAINVDDELVSRGNSIVQFADDGNWDTLKEELESTQNDVIAAMKKNQDEELVILVMLGGWLRGTEAVSKYISTNYAAETARVLRQPAVVDYFVKKIADLPKKVTDTPLMSKVRLSLFEIRKAVTFGSEVTPTVEDVRKLNELAKEVVKIISTKE